MTCNRCDVICILCVHVKINKRSFKPFLCLDLVTEFDCPKATPCSQQDVKTELLTNQPTLTSTGAPVQPGRRCSRQSGGRQAAGPPALHPAATAPGQALLLSAGPAQARAALIPADTGAARARPSAFAAQHRSPEAAHDPPAAAPAPAAQPQGGCTCEWWWCSGRFLCVCVCSKRWWQISLME